MKKARLKITGLIISLFALGYFREYTFEEINAKLGYLKSGTSYTLRYHLSYLNEWSYLPLYLLKYVLIVCFALLFFFLSIAIGKVIFNDRKFTKTAMVFYSSIFLLAFLAFGIGYLIGEWNKGYTLSRYLIEFIESPLATFFLIPAFKLVKSQNL